MPNRIIEYTSETLKNMLLECETPFLVHFGTDWCAPCKKLERVLTELLAGWEGSVQVGKVNVEDERDLAKTYGVSRNPTLCLFECGELVGRLEGFQNGPEVLAFVST